MKLHQDPSLMVDARSYLDVSLDSQNGERDVMNSLIPDNRFEMWLSSIIKMSVCRFCHAALLSCCTLPVRDASPVNQSHTASLSSLNFLSLHAAYFSKTTISAPRIHKSNSVFCLILINIYLLLKTKPAQWISHAGIQHRFRSKILILIWPLEKMQRIIFNCRNVIMSRVILC